MSVQEQFQKNLMKKLRKKFKTLKFESKNDR